MILRKISYKNLIVSYINSEQLFIIGLLIRTFPEKMNTKSLFSVLIIVTWRKKSNNPAKLFAVATIIKQIREKDYCILPYLLSNHDRAIIDSNLDENSIKSFVVIGFSLFINNKKPNQFFRF